VLTRPSPRIPAAAALCAALMLVTAAPLAASDAWSLGASAFLFLPPDDDAYISPIVTADRATLHLEALQHKDLETASLFAGWNLESGDDVVVALTPMAGLVFGNTDGVVPGVEAGVAWRAFELYTEAEYVIAFDDDADDFLYAWVETTGAVATWLRLGLAGQRTRVYDTGLEMQRGLMAAVAHGAMSAGAYWFNPDRSEDQLFVFAAGYEW
jgi:hypothetical protein